MIDYPVRQKRYSMEEYFVLEDKSKEKHEFHNGKIITMPGGTLPHNKIKTNVIRAIENWIEEKNLSLFVFDSDTKVRIEQFNRFVYPDAVVVCEKPEYWRTRKDTIVNPVLIFEVLSKSTKHFDANDKFGLYRSLPSLQEYVLLEQEKPLVSTHWNQGGLWEITTYRSLEESVLLKSIDFVLPMAKVYWKVAELSGDDWEGE